MQLLHVGRRYFLSRTMPTGLRPALLSNSILAYSFSEASSMHRVTSSVCFSTPRPIAGVARFSIDAKRAERGKKTGLFDRFANPITF